MCFFKPNACSNYVKLFIDVEVVCFEATFKVGCLQELKSMILISSSCNFGKLGLSPVQMMNLTG